MQLSMNTEYGEHTEHWKHGGILNPIFDNIYKMHAHTST